jgi:AraC-like DNA-binding protein
MVTRYSQHAFVYMPKVAEFLPNPVFKPLLDAVERYAAAQSGEGHYATAIDGLTIGRADQVKPPAYHIFKPSLCVVLQGGKWATFGEKQYDYRAGQALIVNLEIPSFGRVAAASPDKPYLGIMIEFDLTVMREVIEKLAEPLPASGAAGAGWFIIDFDGPLADCVLRMIRLLDTPKAIPLLYRSMMRELCYWLLSGPNGGDVAKIVLANSHAQSVVRAIQTLRDRFAEPVRIEELADAAQMSLSAFHRQFKALTSMTPLQYQKRLRLIQARNLMATDAANVETAAFRVGYESPSQFSREYARMFGAPPRRDVRGTGFPA